MSHCCVPCQNQPRPTDPPEVGGLWFFHVVLWFIICVSKKSFVWFSLAFGVHMYTIYIYVYFIVKFFFEFYAPRVYRMDALHPRAFRVESRPGMWDIYIYLPYQLVVGDFWIINSMYIDKGIFSWRPSNLFLYSFWRKRYLLKSLGVWKPQEGQCITPNFIAVAWSISEAIPCRLQRRQGARLQGFCPSTSVSRILSLQLSPAYQQLSPVSYEKYLSTLTVL